MKITNIVRCVLLLWISFFGVSLHAATNSNAATKIEASIAADIKSAQQSLIKTEQKISSERQSLGEKMRKLEREVIQLRERSAVTRRMEDEKNLSLKQLNERLDKWRQQQAFARNQLNQFFRSFPALAATEKSAAAPNAIAGNSVANHMNAVVQVSTQMGEQLSPQWKNRTLVDFGGNMLELPTLTIGPITYYWQAGENQAGLAALEKNDSLHLLKAKNSLTGAAGNNIEQLYEKQQGLISFDPTLSRAFALEAQAETPLAHLVKGGVWILPILAFGLAALSIAIFKSVHLWKLPKVTLIPPHELTSAIAQAQQATDADATNQLLKKFSGLQKNLLAIAVVKQPARVRDDLLFINLQTAKQGLDSWLGVIAITASVAPLLGLLGTVSGMIETFKMMTLFGSGDPEVVSGGIAQALITTELGLVVAIPALVLSAVLSRWSKSYYVKLENFALLLSQAGDDEKSQGGLSEVNGVEKLFVDNKTIESLADEYIQKNTHKYSKGLEPA